jgi:hypothetical protein
MTPGEYVAMMITMPSFRGSSMMVRLSITWPMDADEVSNRGVAAVTSTVWVDWPTSRAMLIANWSLTRSAIPEREEVLNPGCSTVIV